MPVGLDDETWGRAELKRAVEAQALADKISVSADVVDTLVTRALANILQQSTDSPEFHFQVQRAIDVLPLVSSALIETGQTSFMNMTSLNAFVRTKSCACPFPWGTG